MIKKILNLFCLLLLVFSAQAQEFVSVNNAFLEAFQSGNYPAALPLGLKMVRLAETEFGKDDVNYAISADNVGNTYAALEQWTAAVSYFQEAKRAYIVATETDQIIEAGLCNNNIGNAFLNLENYDSAAYYFKEAYLYFLQYPQDQYDNLTIISGNLIDVHFILNDFTAVLNLVTTLLPVVKGEEGRESKAYYQLLEHAGNACRRSQQFMQALDFYELAGPVAKILSNTQPELYPGLLEVQAECYRNLGQFKKAESFLLEAGNLYRQSQLQDAYLLGNYYHNLANLYGDIGAFPKAESYYDTAMHLLDKGGFSPDVIYVTVLKSKAYTYMDAGKNMDANLLLQRVGAFYRAVFGPFHPELAEIHLSLANTSFFLNKPAAAAAHLDSSRKVLQQAGLSESYVLARILELEGMIEHSKGNSSKGIGLLKQAGAINGRIFGDSSRYAASVLSNMGIIYQENGNYLKAEEVLRLSFDIVNKLLGIQHPQTALSMANLAMVLVMQSRFDDADKLLAASLEIMLGNGMLATVNSQIILNNIALLAQRQGDYGSAEALYLKVLDNAEQASLSKSIVYETVLANLSTLYLNKKDYEKGLEYALKTRDFAAKRYGKNSLLYIKSLNNVLVGYSKTGAFEKGRVLAAELLPLVKSTMGDSSELVAITLSNMASLEQLSGNFMGAISYYLQSIDIQIHYYKENLYALSERDQISWWQQNAAYFQLLPALLIEAKVKTPAILEQVIRQQLQLKGFVLNNTTASLKRIRNIGDPGLQQLADQWQFTRTLYLKQTSLPQAERAYNTDSLQIISNNLEQAVYKKTGNLQKESVGEIGWKDIQKSMKPGETAVEFIRFPQISGRWYSDTMRYAAMVISAEGPPEIVPLGLEKDIQWCLSGGKSDSRETVVSKLYRTQIGSFKKAAFTGDSLYQLIWKPLQPFLQNKKVVYIAPDGMLHKVAFAALPVGKDSVLLDYYELRQVTSMRQVAFEKAKPVVINEVLLAGHANYNGDGQGMTREYWSDLPGTQNEIDAIAGFFKDQKRKVVKWQGMEASEVQIKNLQGPSPDIIHIATHGFFLPDIQSGSAFTETNASFLSAQQDPLLRSGIILANANKYWQGNQQVKDAEDGILTAYELAQLDWQNTKLVVLSACETGLGELQDGEGVFGLQRALKQSGVQNMILSLWQVPDAETAELMTLFYNGLLEGKSFRMAFHEARRNMRARYKPFEWAAFVLIE